jgi:hypothetical protein
MEMAEMLVYEHLTKYRLMAKMVDAEQARLERQAVAVAKARRRAERAAARLRRAEQARVQLRHSLYVGP